MNSLRIAVLALLSHWRRHRLQGLSIFLGLCLATALWTGVQALNSQARSDYARASAVLVTASQVQVLGRQQAQFDQSLYVRLRLLGWPVSPLLEGRLTLSGATPLSVRLVGIEPLTLPSGFAVAGTHADGFDLPAFIGPPGQTWIGPDTLRRLGLQPGDALRSDTGLTLPPLQVQEGLAPGVVVVDIGQAQRLLQAPGQLSRLLLDGPTRPLPAELAEALRIVPASDDGDLQRLTDSFHLNLSALGLLAFVVGLFIAHAAIGLALEQRRGLLRTLRACGVSLGTVLMALGLELGVFAILGGLVGVAGGYLLAAALLPDVATSVRGLYGAQVAGHLSLSPLWWASGLLVSVAGALLAGVSTLWRAARLPLLALAQAQAWRQAQGPWLRRQVWAALGLGLLAVACWGWGQGLPSAFTLLASLMLAAALLLPALLDLILAALARHCRRPLPQWFVADSRQQLPALSLALMALLLALAASVGVGSMTEGFRQTFNGWLDQRLAADLYLTPRDARQTATIDRWLAEQPTVTARLPTWRTELHLRGWPVQVQGVVAAPWYPQHWPLLAQRVDAWSQLAAGTGVMLSEQLARRLHLGLGDRLAVPLGERSAELTVVGLYADYGNPKGHLLLGADWVREHLPSAPLTGIAVAVAPGSSPALQAQLRERFGLEPSQMVDQATLKAWSGEVFSRTFAATTALNTLTLGVAGLALFISLLTLSQSRLGQLAPLWALGVSRRGLLGLSLGQSVLLAGLTVALAIPLGLLLAWCLVAVINVQAFGWRLPLRVFPLQLLHLAGLGLLTSLAASAWPLWQLARRQPADLLRTFNHDA